MTEVRAHRLVFTAVLGAMLASSFCIAFVLAGICLTDLHLLAIGAGFFGLTVLLLGSSFWMGGFMAPIEPWEADELAGILMGLDDAREELVELGRKRQEGDPKSNTEEIIDAATRWDELSDRLTFWPESPPE